MTWFTVVILLVDVVASWMNYESGNYWFSGFMAGLALMLLVSSIGK